MITEEDSLNKVDIFILKTVEKSTKKYINYLSANNI